MFYSLTELREVEVEGMLFSDHLYLSIGVVVVFCLNVSSHILMVYKIEEIDIPSPVAPALSADEGEKTESGGTVVVSNTITVAEDDEKSVVTVWPAKSEEIATTVMDEGTDPGVAVLAETTVGALAVATCAMPIDGDGETPRSDSGAKSDRGGDASQRCVAAPIIVYMKQKVMVISS